MRYNLIFNKSGIIEEIKGYSKLYRFQKLNESSLEDIVIFTSCFVDDEELHSFLQENHLITGNLNTGNFQIAYFKGKDSNNYSILPFNISYLDEKKFYNINEIIKYGKEHISDPKFMQDFLNTFYIKFKDIPFFREDLNNLYREYQKFLQTGTISSLLNNSYTIFVIKYTTLKNNNNKSKIDFRKLRDLAMFMINNNRYNTLKNIENPELIEHYQALLNEDVSDEEKEVYEDAIRRSR